jgi:hypothetical protein
MPHVMDRLLFSDPSTGGQVYEYFKNDRWEEAGA